MGAPEGTSTEFLTEQTDKIKELVESLHELPGKVNDAANEYRWTPFYLLISEARDSIQEILERVISEVAKVVEGLFAPILFIDYADKWAQIGASVNGANQHQNTPAANLEGYWDGSAYKAYKQSATYQSAAMTSVTAMCNSVKDQLLALATAGRVFYKDFIDQLGTIVYTAAIAIAETAGTAGVAALWTINTLNDALVEMGNLLIGTITGFIELQSTTWVTQNAFEVMLQNPTGFFPGEDGVYRWPSTESEGFNHKDDDWKIDGAD